MRLLISTIIFVGWAAHAQPDYQYLRSQFAIGGKHMCMIAGLKVHCWNTDPERRAVGLPTQKNDPIQVVAGRDHSCLLDAGQVTCALNDGNRYDSWEPPPESMRADELASVGVIACALENTNLKCWGGDSKAARAWEMTGLKNPHLLTMGGSEGRSVRGSSVCVVDDGKVICRGWIGNGEIPLPRPLREPRYVNVSSYNVCVIDADGLVCSSSKAERPILFKNIEQVVGDTSLCALQDARVFCESGYTDLQLNEVRIPFKAVSLAAGERGSFCAVSKDAEVFCWGGGNTNAPWRLPADVFKIAVSDQAVCVLSPSGIRCYGNDEFGVTRPPPLKSPYDISARGDRFCALDADGMSCWQSYDSSANNGFYMSRSQVPHPIGARFKTVIIDHNKIFLTTEAGGRYSYNGQSLQMLGGAHEDKSEAVTIARLKAGTCTVSGMGLDCSDRYRGQDDKPLPKFKNPVVGGDSRQFCIYDSGKMACSSDYETWSRGALHVHDVRGYFRTQPFGIALSELGVGLRNWATYSSPARRLLLEDLASYIERTSPSPSERQAILKLLEPVVVSADSANFTDGIIPAYHAEIGQADSNVSSSKPNDQARAALRVLAATLKVMQNLLEAREQTEVADILRFIAHAMVKPAESETAQVIDSLDAIDLSKFNSPKTEFLLQTLRLSTEKLRASLSK